MPAALELRLQKGVEAIHCRLDTDQPRSERENVGVVVLARQACRQPVGAERGAHRGAAIRGNAYPHAGSANSHTAIGPTALDRLGQAAAVIGIVDRFRPVRAEIDDLQTTVLKLFLDQRLEVVACMVRRDGNCVGHYFTECLVWRTGDANATRSELRPASNSPETGAIGNAREVIPYVGEGGQANATIGVDFPEFPNSSIHLA